MTISLAYDQLSNQNCISGTVGWIACSERTNYLYFIKHFHNVPIVFKSSTVWFLGQFAECKQCIILGGKDLVSKSQILAYYELVLKDFLATGRVKIYSQCEYVGDNKFKSLLENGLEYEITARKKTVDSTYMDVRVPSITKPKFEVAPEITIVPINGLIDIRSPWEKYVVLGAGKTGIDAILFLLHQNVEVDKIIWIMPNDAWLMNRDILEPSKLHATVFDILNTLIR